MPGSSTQDVSLDAVSRELPQPIPYGSIRIQYSGAPGSLIAEISSVEQQRDFVVDAKVENEANGWAGSGGNPWHLDNETESILFLTDMGDKPARIGFKVWANGTVYYLGKLKLVTHETRLINLRKLRHAQQADLEKHTIPRNATDGSVLWIRLDNVPVMGRLAVIRRHGGVASSYDCTLCNCPGVYNNSTTIVPANQCPVWNSNTDELAAEVWFKPECSNTLFYQDLTGQSGWSSSNGSVFTVNNSNPIGLLNALAAGSATATGTPPQQCTNYNLQGGYTCYCTSYSPAGGSGQCSVQQPAYVSVTSPTTGSTLCSGSSFSARWLQV